ncbi:MAG: aminoacyl-tRNA hydrolase [Piscirickettsiaceae bacterium CG_4_9_14_3_um_filter_43_564]|nr:aminoacyl-tRNA hydrolase [Thiomicrospira sp.]OIP96334.1 MAG: aminoacyl-tRNA hydrolase [Thiomicrospira sp. CG2_30_44_34]PIQ04525.1 MAG: aminoacyl-tRNA hydrolase [Piscirickettsiaceae bacterium CG18_big_fil_WC_8_21_14_2_50_44_103]PIU38725.1 MAG: aminoacyl-tRNA hydrolase [Piscirickettsiaceae bacterium CG07_land_8_20_14_0_80_44_28]PIW58075.1 MAG: aminoacyl-tRNA hydrolase [Piscirickettsiaceae bacterium CG12_big_fil_rev_8_21_14_0_65_44_934]PIW78227.1 MAG: aminoacyl-tRNA hydrolase [Piscirickettsiac
MSCIKLIVGLGNPGKQYENTRHNAGFWFVEEVARQYQLQFRPETKFLGEVARVQSNGHDVWLLKPMTFMNRSGQSIQSLANFYKISPDQILVVHDELDLSPGTAKLKSGGGHGGHNGLRDTIAALGTPAYLRLRLGIGHPGHRDQVVDYVLHPPSKPDLQQIETAIYEATRVLPDLFAGELSKAMQQLHSL